MSRVPDRIPPGPIKLTYEDYVELPDDGRRLVATHGTSGTMRTPLFRELELDLALGWE